MFIPSTNFASSNGNGQAEPISLAQSDRTRSTGEEPQPATGQRMPGQLPRLQGFEGLEIGSFSPAPAGSYETYRLMRKNPTIAMARAAATSPIRAAKVSFQAAEGRADEVNDEQIKLITDMIKPQWPLMVRNMLFALDYGWKGFEKVWEIRDHDGQQTTWLRKLKPLRVDNTRILLEKETGNFSGLRQGEVILRPEKAFVFTSDGEDDNLYGRPRHENIREMAWAPWADISNKLGRYVTKASGVIPMVRYTPGKITDMSGASKDAHEYAAQVVKNLGKGHGIIHPVELAPWAEDLLQQGVNVEDVMSWQIKFLEVAAGHGTEFIEMLRHYERLILRGWLVPERVVTEGTHGTKAEAGVHTALAIEIAQELMNEIVRHINWYIIDPILALNFGEDLRGAIEIKPQDLDDDTDDMIRQMMSKILTQPVNQDLLLEFVNFDALIEIAGLPKGETERKELADAADEQVQDSDNPEDVLNGEKIKGTINAAQTAAATGR